MSSYLIGTGTHDVTDPAVGLGMQGMADDQQRTTGVESPLYSRAFVIADPDSGRRVVFACADIWSCTQAVKAAVVERLRARFGDDRYTEANTLICGTHQHSGPGGYSHYYLYNHSMRGFDEHNFECIVSGITASILRAIDNLGAGRIYVHRGPVDDCGRQRSPEAYLANPLAEREALAGDTDPEMLLLKLVRADGGRERPIGALSWYAIHPTDRGQTNTLVCGDNKGFAAALFEEHMGSEPETGRFAAAFANAHCGDVSGNVSLGHRPDGVQDRDRMKLHGRKQFEAARELFESATEELTGPIEARHTWLDLPAATGLPGALGLSMFAGSTEDSDPGSRLREGIVAGELGIYERALRFLLGPGFRLVTGIRCPTASDLTDGEREGHLPKPVTLVPGLARPAPLTPNVVPVQLLRIGGLAITGVPAELTTMAGRRLRAAMLDELAGAGVEHLALATYANGYSQYVTTPEEYAMQHYEGASTLHGPTTLEAYQQAFLGLARALTRGEAAPAGPAPADLSERVRRIRRVTVRNRSSRTCHLRFYRQSDRLMWIPLRDGRRKLSPGAELAWKVPERVAEVKIRFDDAPTTEHVTPGRLVTLGADGAPAISSYEPPWSS